MNKKIFNKKNFIIFVILLIVTFAIWFFFIRKDSSEDVKYVTTAAVKGSLFFTVTGSGNVGVDKSANVSPSVSGTITSVDVSVGDSVVAGQKLMTIKNDQLDISSAQSYASYLQSKQNLIKAQSELVQAQANLDTVNDNDGSTDAQVTIATNAVDTANIGVTIAQMNISSAQSDESKLQAEQSLIKAQSELVQAQANLDTVNGEGGSTTAQITIATNAIDTANLGVTIAQKNIATALQTYQLAITNANERTVTAPIDGTITTFGYSVGDDVSSGGSTSAESSIVIKDFSTLVVVVSINEVDVSNVKAGQKVTMTFDAIDDFTSTGVVESMDSIGTSNSGVVTYPATIKFDKIDARVKSGMTASATITTNTESDVVYVPNASVKTSDTTSYVQVLKDSVPENVTVTIGLANDSFTIIKSGVDEGTEVVSQTIKASSTTSSTSSSSSSSALQSLTSGTSSSTPPAGGPPSN